MVDNERLKALARRGRDHRHLGRVIRAPFLAARRASMQVPRRFYAHLPYHGEFVTRCPGGGEFRMASRGDYLETALFWEGVHGHEAESIDPWIELARSSAVVFDIGANTGMFSLIAGAVSPGVSIHSFEPLARIAERTRINRALNPGFDMTVHQCAVGATDGVATIHDPGGAVPHSASLNAEFLQGVDKDSYDVEVVSIDTFVERTGVESLGLMKLDVEGFEEFALDGMQRTIERYRPAIMMELLTDQNPRVLAHIAAMMETGYELFHMTRGGVRRAATPRKPPEGMNVLLLPAGRSLGSVPILG